MVGAFMSRRVSAIKLFFTMPSVLFAKYKTESGGFYIYDSHSREILRVTQVVYDLIDDIGLLSQEHLVEKWRDTYDEQDIIAALGYVKRFQKGGVMHEHITTSLKRINRVEYDGVIYGVEDFLQSKGHQLILSVTHQCNLRCKYCCYGENSPRGGRTHNEQIMSPEIAEKAIACFLDRSDFLNAISFYGGEPLLNFSLVKHSITFANDYASKLGKKPTFLMTTNGTLLTDEIIHYLVENDVFVHISIDAVKESHDRNRVFRNTLKGSYETVIKNINRFIELYPEYRSRGLIVTLTSPIQIEIINEFLKNYSSYFGSVRVSEVFEKNSTVDSESKIGISETCCSLTCSKHIVEQSFDQESFSFTEEDWEKIAKEWAGFVQLATVNPVEAREKYPLILKLALQPFFVFHDRNLDRYNEKSFSYACHCFPGFTRLYCNAFGDYYPCERVPEIPFFKLGNVYEGFDCKRSIEILESFRHAIDCGNCIIKNECNFCPSFFEFCDLSFEDVSQTALKMKCSAKVSSMINTIQQYTAFMEKNPEALDYLMNFSEIVPPKVFIVFD